MSGYNGGLGSNNEPAGNGPTSHSPAGADQTGAWPGVQATRETSVPATGAEPSGGRNRAVSCVLGFVVGAVFGAVGTVQHQTTLTLGSFSFPLGLILSLVGVLALLIGLRLLIGDRLVVLLAAVGVVGVIALLSVQSPGGSVLIPQGLAGLVWTIGPVLIATVVVAWPRLPERPRTPSATMGEA
ncbi:DUF6113 family protein [Mycetocola zhujimingii]|uniref:DUF6113 family protein n=1 Tax=Mycetocola zhujimingii TaxID=2079792 RepID=UPI0018E07D8C|nr:DUF6113 family protein [Mycetocola zhujimingii]